MLKSYLIILVSALVIQTLDSFTIQKGGHEKHRYFKTEGWLESDHSGSGFHLVDDHVKPNLWMRVFRYDTAVSQVIGLPNNENTGSDAQWVPGDFEGDNPMMKGGDYYRLLKLVDFSTPISAVDSEGNCKGGARCYGDWINNDLLWNYQIKDYVGNDGISFLRLRDNIMGQRRTRYRFDIYVEDNTPFWFKDSDGEYKLSEIPEDGGYNLNHIDEDEETTNAMYYPIEQIVFRICKKDKLALLPDENDPKTQWDAYMQDTEWSEFFVHKKDKDLMVSKTQIQSRRVNGRLVYNFAVFHSFQESSDYIIQLVAEDHSGNRRAMHVPINIEGLRGLEIRDQASDIQKFD